MLGTLVNQKAHPLTIESVRETYSRMYNSERIHPMEKIRLKAWLYHSESRHRNGNPPFEFDHYNFAVGEQLYMDYIKYDLINCDDIGGKEKATDIIQKWYQ